jgi:hypothetical protein
MKWFYNLGMARKLSLTLLVVMSCMVLLGVFSIFRMAKLENSLTGLSSGLIPKAGLLENISVAAADQIQESARQLARLSADMEQTAQWFKVA